MADSQNSDVSESKNEVRRHSRWSEEYDRLPLKQRMKILFAQNRLLPDANWEDGGNSNLSSVTNDFAVKKGDDEQCNSESLCLASFSGVEKIGNLSSEQSETGELKEQVTETNQTMTATATVEKVNVMGTGSFQQPLLSKNGVSMKVKSSYKSPVFLPGNYRSSSSGVDLAAVKIKTESPVDIFDGRDLVPLKERQRMLLSSQMMGLTNSSVEGNPMRLSSSVDNMTQKIPKVVKEKSQSASKELPVARNLLAENENYSKPVILALPHQGRPNSPLEHPGQRNKSTNAGNMTIIKEKNGASSFNKKFTASEANMGKPSLSSNTTMLNPTIKIEPLDEYQTIADKIRASSLPSDGMVPVKYEHDIADDSETDQLDHMLLSQRMKLFAKAEEPSLEIKGTVSLRKLVPSSLDGRPTVPEFVKKLRSDRPRKRRRTATDSVETALEEDAPGLMQVLIEKGVSIGEIKLYGEMESDEALDDSSSDDNFTELESVIAKIYSQRTSLLKLAPLHCTKGEKPSYCLACLFSLVEQARYLQFRKWPVEWGWSRDLQSFIFVFERHNRIVLERPEYGYATYFFELVDSLSIDWQIKRLVIAMKLTSCSRITLIENKALELGEDLTEGEAEVLMKYGWIPNTGLGTMLNYCDRVVHDRKNEKDTSDWRSKICKLLVDGYNGGIMVSDNIPKEAAEYNFAQSPEIKLELE